MLLLITGCPRAEDQDTLGTVQPGEFVGHHMHGSPGKKQQARQRTDKTVARVRLEDDGSPDVTTTRQLWFVRRLTS